VALLSFDNPNLSGATMPRFKRDQTFEKIEVHKGGQWLAFSCVHAVICMLCENRAWSGGLLLKGQTAYPRFGVRHVYASEVDDQRKRQRYRVIMFGLGCPDHEADTVRLVWDRYKRWENGLLCWDHQEYQAQRDIVEMHARSLNAMDDICFRGHERVIGTPIEGETFGTGNVIEAIEAQTKRGPHDPEVKAVKSPVSVPGTWRLRNG